MNIGWMAALTLITFAAMRQPSELVVAQFSSEICAADEGDVAYRLYLPPEDSTGPYPLLIWFHGKGECGQNNKDQLAWLELLLLQESTSGLVPTQTAFSCAILAVQCSAGWHRQSAEFRRVAMATKDVMQRWPIDADRLYLAGISDGAAAAWSYAAEHPRTFAAVVPLGISRPVGHSILHGSAVWAFQATGDGDHITQYVRRLADRSQSHGMSMRYTLVETDGHDCWTAAFRNHAVSRWMLRQRLNGSPVTDHRRWTQVALGIAASTAIGAVVAVVRRCRRKSA